MKIFVFTQERIKNYKMNGGSIMRCSIYKITKNIPEYVGFIDYSTASTCGAISEVFNKLMDLKYIPKKYYNSSKSDWCSGGYYFGEVCEKYKIIELN